MDFAQFVSNGVECWLARIGYSGETGYELVVPAAHAAETWALLLSHGNNDGLLECGLDAMDSLRIEAGHILFMRELAALTDPFELGLARLLDFYPPDFRGATSLLGRRWRAPSRRLVGLLLERRMETAIRTTLSRTAAPQLPAHAGLLRSNEISALGFVCLRCVSRYCRETCWRRAGARRQAAFLRPG